MARKQPHEEHENHERWLVSYADFITLLFAFFVVMYSISSVNEGKYRVLSDSLTSAFRNAPSSLNPVQVGKPLRSPTQNSQLVEVPGTTELMNLQDIEHEMKDALDDLMEQDLATVTRGEDWVQVDIKTSVLFTSGKADLTAAAKPVLLKVAKVLERHPNPLQVEGFTDNVPINTRIFPSNWELSAARAASVVHLFARMGVKPEQMAAVGYGEFRPIADNKTADGRQRNRRVVVVVLENRQVKRFNTRPRTPDGALESSTPGPEHGKSNQP